MLNVFQNNKSTTLTGTLTAGNTSMAATLFSVNPISPTTIPAGTQYTMTLTDGINIEIVSVTGGPTTYTLVRGLEGTTTQTWNVSAVVELRITKEMLNQFAQTPVKDFAAYGGVSDIETGIESGKETNTYWTASSAAAVGDVTIRNSSEAQAFIYIRAGTRSGTVPSVSNMNLSTDGTALFTSVAVNPIHQATNYGTKIGKYCDAFGKGSIAISGVESASIPLRTLTLGNRSVAIGSGAQTMQHESISLGTFALCTASSSVSIGPFSKANHSNGLFTGIVPAKPVPAQLNDLFINNSVNFATGVIDTNLVGVIWSKPIDFTGGATWAASTSKSHGRVVKPTVPNAFMYYLEDPKYDLFSKTVSYTPGSTGSSEPIWPTSQSGPFDGVSDGTAGIWKAVPLVGYTLSLPNNFIVEEIGIVIFEYTSITAQPFVSFGKTGATTQFLASTQTTGLTAANKVQRWQVLSTEAVDSLVINVDTLATGTTMLGQVYFKGFYAKHWL